MSPTVDVRPARATDVGPIASDVREIDALEAAVVGMTVRQALRHGIRCGDAWTITVDGKRAIMFGVVDTSVVEGRGRVWAIATHLAEANWRELIRLGVSVLSMLTDQYMTLENYVHDDNAKAIRWLRWSGFQVGEPQEVRGQMLRKIVLCADH